MNTIQSAANPAAPLPEGWEAVDGDGNASGAPVRREFTMKKGGGGNKDEKAMATAASTATAVGAFWAHAYPVRT